MKGLCEGDILVDFNIRSVDPNMIHQSWLSLQLGFLIIQSRSSHFSFWNILSFFGNWILMQFFFITGTRLTVYLLEILLSLLRFYTSQSLNIYNFAYLLLLTFIHLISKSKRTFIIDEYLFLRMFSLTYVPTFVNKLWKILSQKR